MKKFLKWFLGLAAVGSAVGLIIAYFCKDRHTETSPYSETFCEEEDFDLDSDLKPVEREYVPLKKITPEEPLSSSQNPETDSPQEVEISNSNISQS